MMHIDRAVERVLTLRFELGLFKNLSAEGSANRHPTENTVPVGCRKMRKFSIKGMIKKSNRLKRKGERYVAHK